MKKALSILLTISFVLTLAVVGVVPSYATTITGTSVTYSFNNITKTLTFGGTGAIPSYDDCYDEDDHFVECTYPWKGIDYTSVEIGEGITEIGNFAFCKSTNLKIVTIPDTVLTIGKGAFRDCENLESISISNEVTTINESTFDGCSSLVYVELSDKLNEIQNNAFYSCTALKNIDFPSTLTAIGDKAFGNTGLTKLVLPAELTTIGKNAFSSCYDLTEVSLNNKLTSLGTSAFRYDAIEEITFPESLTTIPSQVCSECTNLKKVVLPDSITKIDSKAFYKCSSLTEIEIPYTVNIIGDKALGYTGTTAKVADFTIKGYEDSSDAKNYADTNGLIFDSLGKVYEGTCGEKVTWSYDKDNNVLTLSGEGAMTNFTAENPAGFAKFAKLAKSIVIGDGITAVGDYAFYGFNNPTITLSDCKTLATIGKYAFYNISNSFYVPSTVTAIGEKAIGQFDTDGKADESFTISGANFSYAKTYALTNGFKFVIEDASVPNEGKCGENITWKFDKDTGTLTISGDGAMQDYTATELPQYLYHHISKIVIESGVTTIGAYAFYGADSVTEIVLNPTIMNIGVKAVGYKPNLENEAVKIDDFKIYGYDNTVASIYATDNGFDFVSNGKYSGSNGYIGEAAGWIYDEKTKTITIFGSGETYAYSKENLPAFADYDIETIIIEDGITKIGDCGLLGIKSVKKIRIAHSVESFGSNCLGYVLNSDSEFIKVDGVTIEGYDGSFAQGYANANEFAFTSLGKYGLITGKCGDNVNWCYDSETKSLELTGTGDTYDYTLDNLPEYFNYEISDITVNDGITSLGNNIFVLTTDAYERIDCPKSIAKVGENAIGFIRTVKKPEVAEAKDEYIYTAMSDLTIAGYIVTPVYDYAKANSFKFIALDDDRVDFSFKSLPIKINQTDKLLLVYFKNLTLEKFNEDCTESATSAEFKTGGKLSFTKDDKTCDYTVIIVGDATAEGTVNSSDALAILNHTVQNKELDGNNLLAADVDGDGKVNSTDALKVLQITVDSIKVEDLYKK